MLRYLLSFLLLSNLALSNDMKKLADFLASDEYQQSIKDSLDESEVDELFNEYVEFYSMAKLPEKYCFLVDWMPNVNSCKFDYINTDVNKLALEMKLSDDYYEDLSLEDWAIDASDMWNMACYDMEPSKELLKKCNDATPFMEELFDAVLTAEIPDDYVPSEFDDEVTIGEHEDLYTKCKNSKEMKKFGIALDQECANLAILDDETGGAYRDLVNDRQTGVSNTSRHMGKSSIDLDKKIKVKSLPQACMGADVFYNLLNNSDFFEPIDFMNMQLLENIEDEPEKLVIVCSLNVYFFNNFELEQHAELLKLLDELGVTLEHCDQYLN